MPIPNLQPRATESESQTRNQESHVYQALKFVSIRKVSEIVLEGDRDINQVGTFIHV